MAEIIYDDGADLSLIQSKKVANTVTARRVTRTLNPAGFRS